MNVNIMIVCHNSEIVKNINVRVLSCMFNKNIGIFIVKKMMETNLITNKTTSELSSNIFAEYAVNVLDIDVLIMLR